MSGKERSQMPHRASHDMIMVTKYDRNPNWMISGEIMSQEQFIKNDIKCVKCNNWLSTIGKRCI